jgi:hypothetical protein
MAPEDTPWLVAFFTMGGACGDAYVAGRLADGSFTTALGASALRFAPALLACGLSALAYARRTRPRMRALLHGRTAVTFVLLAVAAIALALATGRTWVHGGAVALGQTLLLLIAAGGTHELINTDHDGWAL